MMHWGPHGTSNSFIFVFATILPLFPVACRCELSVLLFLFPKTFSFAFSALFPGSFVLSRLRSPLLRVFGWVWTFTHCRSTEPSSVLVCCFREVTDTVVVWIVDGRRVIIRRNHLVRLVGLMTCGVGQVGHVAKVILTVSEVHRTRAFGSG